MRQIYFVNHFIAFIYDGDTQYTGSDIDMIGVRISHDKNYVGMTTISLMVNFFEWFRFSEHPFEYYLIYNFLIAS